MAIFPGGGPARSTAINSPRHLTLRNARRLFVAGEQNERELTLAAPSEDDDDPEPVLLPGEEKVYSYWAPGLEAGQKHHVKVNQTVSSDNQTLPLAAEKVFFVDAPQFSLPQGTIHSIYPPQGYSDDNRILPHIVLTDPHLPWERLGSPNTHVPEGERPRTRVPWLVLFSFTQDELILPPEHLNGPGSIFASTSSSVIKPVKQSSTGTVNMSIGDLWATTKSKVVTTPITDQLGPDSIKNARGDFIFVKPDLFTSLFSNFDENGDRKVPSSPNTTPYGLLAHVKHINGEGMAVAGVEDTAIFSLIIGNRAGPLDNPTPATVSVHLVSIEGVEDMRLPISADAKYVALCSLHSWNYTVNPPGMVNVREFFEHLGRTLDVLRMPEAFFVPLEKQPSSKVQQRVAARLRDGYSLVRHRLQTGEETVAFFRGPFTPTIILDSDVGIMDITYSAAWQLGRTLALGDEGFTSALGRLRTSIRSAAMKEAKIAAINSVNSLAYRSREEVLQGLSSLYDDLSGISGNESAVSAEAATDDAKGRWSRRRLARSEIPDLSFSSPVIEAKYPNTALSAAHTLGESVDGNVYDELNDPASTNWRIVLTWLLGRMYLDGVPAHYLITDPSHLPQETLRFFYIDPNWVDALIDGALSLGNHMGVDQDRVAIKKALNRYITNTPKHLDFAPQIPTYGFYLRSDLVSMFPDLRVTTLPARPQLPPGFKDRAPLLRHDIITDGVMLGLLDRVPGTPEFDGLVFTQPAHQQRYAVSPTLNTETAEFHIHRQYTLDKATRLSDEDRAKSVEPPIICHRSPDSENSKNPLFTWGSAPGKNDLRIMQVARFAQTQLDKLNRDMPTYRDGDVDKKYFSDGTATSALFSMQLRDPVYNLKILFKGAAIDEASHTPAAFRTLTSLQPPIVERLRARRAITAGDSGPSQESPKHSGEVSNDHDSRHGHDDQPAQPVTFKRHADYVPPEHGFWSMAPHLRAIPIVDLPALETSDDVEPEPTETAPEETRAELLASTSAMTRRMVPFEGRDPATGPRFVCTVHTRDVRSGVIEIPPETRKHEQLPQDLVFSIHATNNTSEEWDLMELAIMIPLGPAPTDPKGPYFVMKEYAGPGATMLSNLRFNVVVALVTPGNNPALQLRILPRSSKGHINITKVQDLSFLLGMVDVNRWMHVVGDDRPRQTRIETRAYYTPEGGNPIVDSNVLVTVYMM
ncbi:hypothetical protein F5144DRAFT_621236 [Chaetomium tenue]|uniref:Uncharacterized protein n=1 Tax=Chaetomium tenue TaxID=1854479 RepID=A0ACB7PAG4_9PEZI|nr:hypothetical protein F5144DRAFT_621236 [Chaetomium globosum]